MISDIGGKEHPFWYLYVLCVAIVSPLTVCLCQAGYDLGFGWIGTIAVIIGYGIFVIELMKDHNKTKYKSKRVPQ